MTFTDPKGDTVPTTTSRIDRISLVIVPATDQDKSIEFYEEALGFEKRTDIPFGDKYRWVEVYPPSGAPASRWRRPASRTRSASRPASR